MTATEQTKKRKVYLDHAAATPLCAEAEEAMREILRGGLDANPSAIHAPGRAARERLDAARESVAKVLEARPREIIFTGSGTESDNMALFGAARAYKEYGRHLVVSAIEHKAVLESALALEGEGFEVSRVGVDADGVVDMEELAHALRPDTILVSVMYANNEIGTLQPVRDIARRLRAFRNGKPANSYRDLPLFHTDACQAAGSQPLSVVSLGVDLLTLNGSKIYGPRGVGCLYAREGVRLSPLVRGGGQERGVRAGTENLLGIVGFARALEVADKTRDAENARLSELRDYFFEEVEKRFDRVVINGDREKRLPNNINISFPGLEGESLVLYLDEKGIATATGSACTSRDLAPSHVISALDPDPLRAHGSVRLSLGRSTTRADLDYTLEALEEVVAILKKVTVTDL